MIKDENDCCTSSMPGTPASTSSMDVETGSEGSSGDDFIEDEEMDDDDDSYEEPNSSDYDSDDERSGSSSLDSIFGLEGSEERDQPLLMRVDEPYHREDGVFRDTTNLVRGGEDGKRVTEGETADEVDEYMRKKIKRSRSTRSNTDTILTPSACSWDGFESNRTTSDPCTV